MILPGLTLLALAQLDMTPMGVNVSSVLAATKAVKKRAESVK